MQGRYIPGDSPFACAPASPAAVMQLRALGFALLVLAPTNLMLCVMFVRSLKAMASNNPKRPVKILGKKSRR